jgi:hypothetical protein
VQGGISHHQSHTLAHSPKGLESRPDSRHIIPCEELSQKLKTHCCRSRMREIPPPSLDTVHLFKPGRGTEPLAAWVLKHWCRCMTPKQGTYSMYGLASLMPRTIKPYPAVPNGAQFLESVRDDALIQHSRWSNSWRINWCSR